MRKMSKFLSHPGGIYLLIIYNDNTHEVSTQRARYVRFTLKTIRYITIHSQLYFLQTSNQKEMGRTKQTARKSTGGRAPIFRLRTRTHAISVSNNFVLFSNAFA